MTYLKIFVEEPVAGQGVYSFWKFLTENRQEDSKVSRRVFHQVQSVQTYRTERQRGPSLGRVLAGSKLQGFSRIFKTESEYYDGD